MGGFPPTPYISTHRTRPTTGTLGLPSWGSWQDPHQNWPWPPAARAGSPLATQPGPWRPEPVLAGTLPTTPNWTVLVCSLQLHQTLVRFQWYKALGLPAPALQVTETLPRWKTVPAVHTQSPLPSKQIPTMYFKSLVYNQKSY
jgi:hypothetical protein